MFKKLCAVSVTLLAFGCQSRSNNDSTTQTTLGHGECANNQFKTSQGSCVPACVDATKQVDSTIGGCTDNGPVKSEVNMDDNSSRANTAENTQTTNTRDTSGGSATGYSRGTGGVAITLSSASPRACNVNNRSAKSILIKEIALHFTCDGEAKTAVNKPNKRVFTNGQYQANFKTGVCTTMIPSHCEAIW